MSRYFPIFLLTGFSGCLPKTLREDWPLSSREKGNMFWRPFWDDQGDFGLLHFCLFRLMQESMPSSLTNMSSPKPFWFDALWAKRFASCMSKSTKRDLLADLRQQLTIQTQTVEAWKRPARERHAATPD